MSSQEMDPEDVDPAKTTTRQTTRQTTTGKTTGQTDPEKSALEKSAGGQRRAGRAPRPLPDHPVRLALLDLLAELGTVTSTQAAARLGHSSGLCSFHLRQLARHGLIEEAPHKGGKVRPWRLRWASRQPGTEPAPGLGDLARDLEDESYQRWLAHRDQAPAPWRHDESFSAVVHLTPAETTELAASIRHLLDGYRDRDDHPSGRPADSTAVAAVIRLFPLVTAESPGVR